MGHHDITTVRQPCRACLWWFYTREPQADSGKRYTCDTACINTPLVLLGAVFTPKNVAATPGVISVWSTVTVRRKLQHGRNCRITEVHINSSIIVNRTKFLFTIADQTLVFLTLARGPCNISLVFDRPFRVIFQAEKLIPDRFDAVSPDHVDFWYVMLVYCLAHLLVMTTE